MELTLLILPSEEIEDRDGMPFEYDDIPAREMTFYNVDAIEPSVKGYSILHLSGYEYIVRKPYKQLKGEISKQKRIIISDN